MEHYLSSINVDLNSAYATSSITDTSAEFHMDHAIVAPPHTHLLAGMKSFSMPNLFYTITSANQTFTITCTSTEPGEVSSILTIPTGNYKGTPLINALNSGASAVLTDLNIDALGFSLDTVKQRIYWVVVSGTYTLTNISFQTPAYRVWGFSDADAYDNTGLLTAYFPRAYNISGMNQLFVRLSNFEMDNRNMRNISGIIGTIPVSASPMDIIFFDAIVMPMFKLHSTYVNHFSVELLDEDMNAMGDFEAGGEFRLTLNIQFSWDKDNLHPNIFNKKILTNDHTQPKDKQDGIQVQETKTEKDRQEGGARGVRGARGEVSGEEDKEGRQEVSDGIEAPREE